MKGPGFSARSLTRSPLEVRRDWVAAIDLAGAVSKAALRDPSDAPTLGGAQGDIARLMATLRYLKHDNFPAPAWSARIMAAAFLTLANAFVRQEMGPEARTACAAFLGEGAKTLDALMADLNHKAAAQTWGRNQFGADD